MSIDALPESLQQLDQIPIERLGLSDKALSVLKWHGITSILTCVLFFYYDAHDTDTTMIFHWSRRYDVFMYDEVEPRMKEHGYWSFVEDADIWRVIKREKLSIKPRMVVHWQGKDQDLCHIPLKQLGLSDEAFKNISQSFGSVSDCIDYFVRNFNQYRRTRLGMEILRDNAGASRKDLIFTQYMFDEVEPRLMELGYWRFVEDHVD